MTATAITLVKNRKGDFVIHTAGCSDINRKDNREPVVYTGADLQDAITTADTDMASWFCEEPYTEDAVENGCWTVSGCSHAPCFQTAVKSAGITFDAHSSKPSATAAFNMGTPPPTDKEAVALLFGPTVTPQPVGTKRFTVVKRVVMEYTYEVDAVNGNAARALADDMGELNGAPAQVGESWKWGLAKKA